MLQQSLVVDQPLGGTRFVHDVVRPVSSMS